MRSNLSGIRPLRCCVCVSARRTRAGSRLPTGQTPSPFRTARYASWQRAHVSLSTAMAGALLMARCACLALFSFPIIDMYLPLRCALQTSMALLLISRTGLAPVVAPISADSFVFCVVWLFALAQGCGATGTYFISVYAWQDSEYVVMVRLRHSQKRCAATCWFRVVSSVAVHPLRVFVRVRVTSTACSTLLFAFRVVLSSTVTRCCPLPSRAAVTSS